MESMMDASLLWESSKRIVRRPSFPSWSWSGWFGEIQWRFTDQVQSWIEWREDSEQQYHPFPQQRPKKISPPLPRPANKITSDGQVARLLPSILRFRTIGARFKLISPTSIHKAVISPLRKRLTGPSALSTVRPAPTDPGLIRAGIADRDDTWCGTIDLDERWQSRIGIPLEFLVMSRVDAFTQDEMATWDGTLPDDVEDILTRFRYGVYNVLLVSKKDGICYREGLGRILIGALKKALDPGPAWQEVMLG